MKNSLMIIALILILSVSIQAENPNTINYQKSADIQGFDVQIATPTDEPAFSTASSVNSLSDHPDDIYWDNSISPSIAGVIGEVYTTIVYDGMLIIGGTFSVVGDVIANDIAAWDGSSWQTLGSGMGKSIVGNSVVRSLTIYNGDLIAGGYFSSAGGVEASNIARWDGSTWQPLGSPVIGTVSCLAVYDGELIAGGGYEVSPGEVVDIVVRWDGSSWQPLGSGMGPHDDCNDFLCVVAVNSLTVHNGELIATGSFGTAGGVEANRIVRWNGSTWQAFGSVPEGGISCLTVYNGDLIAATAATINPFGDADISQWDGSTWQRLGSGMNGRVFSLTVYNGDLIAGGRFTTAGGVEANHIARWNGSDWQPLGDGIRKYYSAYVYSLTVYNSKLIAAGSFTPSNPSTPNNIYVWDDSKWQPLILGINDRVYCSVVWNGDLIAGGSFTTVGGVEANHIARWDGSTWQPLSQGMSGDVWSLKVYDGELIAGGSFGTAGGITANRVARWDGSTWQPFGSGMKNGGVYSMTVYDGDLIVGGKFTMAGGITANRVARWDGSTWQPFGQGMNGDVSSLTVYNGDLIAGGRFTTADGVEANHIARWDGSSWQPLGSGIGWSHSAISNVSSLMVYDGELIAGGAFGAAGGVKAMFIAGWDGSAWHQIGSGMSGPVWSLKVYDGELIAGGSFGTAGGITANRVARWDGSTWQPFGSGMNSRVRSLTVYDGTLIAGGSFTTAGGKVSAYLAQWTKQTALTVDLDIKPGSCPNPLNAMNHSKGKSVLPVAILGTIDFDIQDIDPETVTLNGISPLRWSYEDVSTPVDKDSDSCACTEDGPDGYEDLTLKFDRQSIVSSLNFISSNQLGTMTASTKGTLSASDAIGKLNHSGPPLRGSYVLRVEGQLKDGSAFDGYDCVVLSTKGEVTATILSETPRDLELIGNQPNPFNPATQIHFYLPEAANVRIDIYNVLGQRITRLVDGVKEAGEHVVEWDGSKVASGLYFYRFQTGDYVETKKMLLLK